ncbi:MBL fold metallo-hydrolase [Fulvivirgaceae bacterium BMA10]|uniref:MBL fold metallo-hydrolase n=1 Tax=Splendidivirga corallicola TaxID=3051826 RepID=A0ABT8KQK3_9BACT|nr:MBL fold metallo-hydrolase [Fulvivirgaceae bacterium BMA10]
MIKVLDLNFQETGQTIASFLIETSIGPILIESGPYSSFENLKQKIGENGYSIEDVQHVLITHIHLDHAGAAWALAQHGAKIYLHPFGEKHMADPTRLWNSAKLIYGDDMERLWGDMQAIDQENLEIVSHGERLIFGDVEITGWHTPGHAKHHIAWQLNDVLFSGDVAGVKINDGPVVPPCPPPDIDLEAWEESLTLIKGLDLKRIYLTHFGIIENIVDHLAELEHNLSGWSMWIKDKFELNRDVESLVPEFQAFTTAQMKDQGLDDHTIRQYEIANPSWMSVVGLMRYWKIKKEKG